MSHVSAWHSSLTTSSFFIASLLQKSKKKQKNTFRVGALHRTGRHGDHGTHFRANGEAVGRLVNVQPAKRPRLGVNDALGSWTPFTEEGWAQSASLADEVVVEIPPIRKRYLSSDNPMAVWRKHKAKFLDELLRAEGLGGGFHIPTCAHFCNAKTVSNGATNNSLYIVHRCGMAYFGQHVLCTTTQTRMCAWECATNSDITIFLARRQSPWCEPWSF
ncbi:CxC2 domain-containing protein [Mycena indigotica]|uniref:CxC2 domain-containing protein n=1 Tax=Mycena indigotica TaxID=2126181 RepID=A0A8H6W967_9AGAR|nr:CxC2 domain-containing protein [Mycena indigotica]KAF7306303.1 CxC2 domain-containing protein [Mycena indigotica]